MTVFRAQSSSGYTGQYLIPLILTWTLYLRWCRLVLGLFLAPDTLVPEPGEPSHGDSLRSQALNRYRTLTTTPHGIPMQRGMASTGRRTSG